VRPERQGHSLTPRALRPPSTLFFLLVIRRRVGHSHLARLERLETEPISFEPIEPSVACANPDWLDGLAAAESLHRQVPAVVYRTWLGSGCRRGLEPAPPQAWAIRPLLPDRPRPPACRCSEGAFVPPDAPRVCDLSAAQKKPPASLASRENFYARLRPACAGLAINWSSPEAASPEALRGSLQPAGCSAMRNHSA